MNAILIENLSKSYGKVQALKGINLEIKENEIFGLIGPDGAGKTTLIRILTSLIYPDAGSSRVIGLDPIKDYKQLRNKIGYMPGRFSLYQDLSVEENLTLFASLYDTTIEANYHLIADIYVQIEPFKNRKAGALSGGMKQKLALCCAMIHKPEILFLDEPTTGVDPVSRKEFWEMLKKLNEEGLPILVSTPYMDEADRCNRVGFIQEGTILGVDTPKAITHRFTKTLWGIRTADKHRLMTDLKSYEGYDSAYSFGSEVHYTDKDSKDVSKQLIQYLEKQGHDQIVIEKIHPGIEDTFMQLMTK